jgi:hypothetical protein
MRAARSSVDQEHLLAFRLARNHLGVRLPSGSLLMAAGPSGVENTPPGSAALARHARVANFTPADIDRAFEVDKTLLQAWSLLGSPYVFPTSDAAVFTLGMLSEDEESLRFFLLGMQQGLGSAI